MVLKVSPAISILNQLTCLELSMWEAFNVDANGTPNGEIALPSLSALTRLELLYLNCVNAEVGTMPGAARLYLNTD